jgi:hypothetical protein
MTAIQVSTVLFFLAVFCLSFERLKSAAALVALALFFATHH